MLEKGFDAKIIATVVIMIISMISRIPAGRNFISSLLLAIFIILAVVLMSKTLYTYAWVNEGSATSHNHRYLAARILQ